MASLSLLLLGGCTPAPAPPPPEGQIITSDLTDSNAPAGAPEGTCWEKDTSPAVIKTVTRRILLTPADISPDGIIRSPAEYRNEDSYEIVTPRRNLWTEVLCPETFTPEFTASLQRALAARGYYTAGITGRTDVVTQRAITAYQEDNGIEARDLTSQAAARLGLVVSPV